MTKLILTLLSLTWVLFCGVLSSQINKGNLTGIVRDQSGAAVVEASVRLINPGTAAARQERSDATGFYRFSLLDAGVYQLEVEMEGFKKFVQQNIRIQIGQTTTVDVGLDLGQLSESVTVTAESALLRTETGSLGNTVSGAAVNELPILTRSALNFLQVAPGVQYASGTPLNVWDNDGPSRFAVNGSQARSEILIDGVPNMRPSAAGQLGGAAGFSPSPEAIDEVRVQTNAYDAEYGYSGGAFINLATKSGSNNLRGALYWYHRNDNLNANSWFNNLNGRSKSENKENSYGASIGGPVILPKLYNGRDRTHFFVDFEGTQGRNFNQQNVIVPTALERQGDFSQTTDRLGNRFTIYDPSTTRPSGNGFVRSPYANNTIPLADQDPAALKITDFYSLPNAVPAPQTKENFINPRRGGIRWSSVITRVDHQINDSHHLFVRYGWNARLNLSDQYWHGLAISRSVGGGEFYRRQFIMAASDTWVMNPSTVVDFRVGFYRYVDGDIDFSAGYNLAELGFPASFTNSVDWKVFPRVNMADVTHIGGQEEDNRDATASVDPVVNFNTTLGRHTLKYGFRARGSQVNAWTAGRSSGLFTFDRTFTRGPDPTRNTTNAGHDFASFLLGALPQGYADIKAGKTVLNTYWGTYLQEDWKATDRLTLNLGLRLEHENGVVERYDRGNGGFDFGVASPIEAAAQANYAQAPIPELAAINVKGGLQFLNVGIVPRENLHMPSLTFSPRFGFAYRLKDWVVWRGGWGVFLAPNQTDNFTQDGFSLATQMVTSLDGNLTPFRTLSNPFPDGLTRPPGSSGGLLTGLGQNLLAGGADETGVPRYRHGLSQQFSMGFQFALPGELSVETSYVGNVSQRLMVAQYNQGSLVVRGRQINDIPNEALALKTRLNARVPNPFFGVVTDRTSVLSQPTTTVQQLLRPYPHFLALTQSALPLGRSHYDSLQVNVQRRFAEGFYFGAAAPLAETCLPLPEKPNDAGSA